MVNAKLNPKNHILTRLRTVAGGKSCISGSEFAEELGISRVAVWKHIEALREAGYAIAAERGGYRLTSEGDFLHPWEFPGRERRIVRYERTGSTMDRALELALVQPRCRAIVVAEEQTAGRGRRGQSWQSPRGGLFATLVVIPTIAAWKAERAVMAGGIALCQALRQLTGEPFTVEWPNDVYLDGRKAAGLLVEYLAEGENLKLLNLGLGVNVANRAPSSGSISLNELPGSPIPRRDVLAAFLDRFEAIDLTNPDLAEKWNALSPYADIWNSWKVPNLSRALSPPPLSPPPPSRPIAISRDDGSRLGCALGIDDEGRLLVETRSGGIRACRPSEARISGKGRKSR